MGPTRYTVFVTWPVGVRPPSPDERPTERPDGSADERWTYRNEGYAKEWAEYYRGLGATVRVLAD